MKDHRLNDARIKLIQDHRIYSSSLEESAKMIVRQSAQALLASRASIWLMTDTNDQFRCLSLYISEGDTFEKGATLSAELYPNYFSTLLSSLLVDVEDTFLDPRTKELSDSYLKPLDVRSLLDVPLIYEGKVKGVLCIEMVGERRKWTSAEKSYISAISDLILQCFIVNELGIGEQRYKALFDCSNEGVVVYQDGQFSDVNAALCDIFQCQKDDLVGSTPIDFSPEFQQDGQRSDVKAFEYIDACMQGTPQTFEWVHRRKNGECFEAEITLNAALFSGVTTLFGMIRDISEKKVTERLAFIAKEELSYRASHDSLTGLKNREQLHLLVQDLINDAANIKDKKIVLMLFDLNGFKEVNDTLGHVTGDKVLQQVAFIVELQVNNINGFLFRLGGDEFVAVFDSETCKIPFNELDFRLNNWLKETIEIDDIHVEMAASVGFSLFPENGKDSDELLRCADVAMYHNKNNDGVSPWYSSSNDVNSRRRLAIIVDLRKAISQDELFLHFQPRMEISTGKITGCEALIQWQHPEIGLVSSNEFLPLAEMSDVIHHLSIWVLNSVMKQIKALHLLDIYLPIALNLSARNLADDFLISFIDTLLDQNDIEPHYLEIEITESALVNYPARVMNNLNRLNDMGVSMAVDDFGTGYSSLKNLKQLPIDTLKIDHSFVKDMINDPSDALIVKSVVTLGHEFAQTVIAEGVENQQTLDVLKGMGCDQAQGFFIAKPMPADDLQRWLQDNYSLNLPSNA